MNKQNQLFLKNTVRDPSLVNIVWSNRLDQAALPISSTVERDYYSAGVISHGEQKYGKNPNIVGLHNGTAFGQDQSEPYWQKRQMDPYPYPNGPYESNDLKDIMNPTMHVNELASSGGNPLTIALDDLNMIDQFIDSEHRRNYPFNPLSAAYARKAMEKLQEHPVQGPENDALRRTMLDDQEHAEVKGRKIAAGFYSERVVDQQGGVHLNPEIQNWLDGRAPPTRADFQNLHHRIAEAVHHQLNGNYAAQQGDAAHHLQPNDVLRNGIGDNNLLEVQRGPDDIINEPLVDRDGRPAGEHPPDLHNVGGDQQPAGNLLPQGGLAVGGQNIFQQAFGGQVNEPYNPPPNQNGWLGRLGNWVEDAFGRGN